MDVSVLSYGLTVQVKLDLSQLEGINDDMEFALQLVKEESVIVLPGKFKSQF